MQIFIEIFFILCFIKRKHYHIYFAPLGYKGRSTGSNVALSGIILPKIKQVFTAKRNPGNVSPGRSVNTIHRGGLFHLQIFVALACHPPGQVCD